MQMDTEGNRRAIICNFSVKISLLHSFI